MPICCPCGMITALASSSFSELSTFVTRTIGYSWNFTSYFSCSCFQNVLSASVAIHTKSYGNSPSGFCAIFAEIISFPNKNNISTGIRLITYT